MSQETRQQEELQPVEGGFRVVQDETGVHFEKRVEPEKTGTAYIEPEKAKTRRDQEIEAGRARVAAAAERVKNRPPLVISENERRAQGQTVSLFRPNMSASDRMNGGLGPLMRKVGGNVKVPE